MRLPGVDPTVYYPTGVLEIRNSVMVRWMDGLVPLLAVVDGVVYALLQADHAAIHMDVGGSVLRFSVNLSMSPPLMPGHFCRQQFSASTHLLSTPFSSQSSNLGHLNHFKLMYFHS